MDFKYQKFGPENYFPKHYWPQIWSINAGEGLELVGTISDLPNPNT